MISNPDPAVKAKEYAFLLLKFRQRSEKEISERLKQKKFPQEVIARTITFLREKKFIDDGLFARAWIRERLARSLGPRRIRQELGLKGISKEIIESGLQELEGTYSEAQTAEELAKRRFASLKDIDPRAAKRRIYAYLLRRGFSPDAVIGAVNQLDNSSE